MENPFVAVYKFVNAIDEADWTSWIGGVIFYLFVFALSVRRATAQGDTGGLAGLLVSAVGQGLALGYVNDFLGDRPVVIRGRQVLPAQPRWQAFATQNYFDESGFFAFAILGLPLTFIALYALVNLLLLTAELAAKHQAAKLSHNVQKKKQ